MIRISSIFSVILAISHVERLVSSNTEMYITVHESAAARSNWRWWNVSDDDLAG